DLLHETSHPTVLQQLRKFSTCIPIGQQAPKSAVELKRGLRGVKPAIAGGLVPQATDIPSVGPSAAPTMVSRPATSRLAFPVRQRESGSRDHRSARCSDSDYWTVSEVTKSFEMAVSGYFQPGNTSSITN